jgi:hypothetical protein
MYTAAAPSRPGILRRGSSTGGTGSPFSTKYQSGAIQTGSFSLYFTW